MNNGRKPHAIVVAPGAGADQVKDSSNRRWLGRASTERSERGSGLLEQTLSLLGLQAQTSNSGTGALRLLGQTGERPAGWIAAADPVFLEAGLNHVALHPVTRRELRDDEVASIFAHLQSVLGSGHACRFSSSGICGYLQRARPMATASVSPAVAGGDSPADFMPAGEPAAEYHRLQGEVQMCLHELELNLRRGQAGLRPVNALWFWGGGTLPPDPAVELPPLFADDPLFRGYWLNASAETAPMPGDLQACRDAAPGGFVAVLPESAEEAEEVLDRHLRALHYMLKRGTLREVTLVFDDGLLARARRPDLLRWWRRSPHITAGRRAE